MFFFQILYHYVRLHNYPFIASRHSLQKFTLITCELGGVRLCSWLSSSSINILQLMETTQQELWCLLCWSVSISPMRTGLVQASSSYSEVHISVFINHAVCRRFRSPLASALTCPQSSAELTHSVFPLSSPLAFLNHTFKPYSYG